MAINPASPTPGQAGFWSDDVGALVELWAGDTPAPVTISVTYDTAQGVAGIPANTPVRVANEGAALVLIVDALRPSAVTSHAVLPGSPPGNVGVYKSGMFNINALNWPATLTTEAARLGAFDLSACQIYVKKPYYS